MKMYGKKDLSFDAVRKPSFYVTQPMRMTTVQPLPALGLIDASSDRFNSFACTPVGLDFIEVSCVDYNPCHYSKSVLDFLVMWARGEHDRVAVSPNLGAALSPLQPLSKIAREFLRERLVQIADDKVGRRRAALAWVDGLDSGSSQQADWDTKPKILDQSHWRDLHTGALFFTARSAALSLCWIDLRRILAI